MNDPEITIIPPTAPPMDTTKQSQFFLTRTKSKVLSSREKEQLKKQGFPLGFAQSIAANNAVFPLRIWIVDNSGSMNASDGCRYISKKRNELKICECTRWKEIQEVVLYHAQLAGLLESSTVFRMLNIPPANVGPQIFSIGQNGHQNIPSDVHNAMNIISKAYPSGVTPLTQHIHEIRNFIVNDMLPILRQNGQKVSIIIATDGLPSDDQGVSGEYEEQNFINSLKSLEGLPVWIVIRLCTSNDSVVEFYNNLDRQLELSVEVIDDFVSESQEIYKCNPWLIYGLPLHRCREMGYHHRIFDLLDERKLTLSELRDFLILLFGAENFDGIEDPEVDFEGFYKSLKSLLEKEDEQFNPITKKMSPWVDTKKLKATYAASNGCCIM